LAANPLVASPTELMSPKLWMDDAAELGQSPARDDIHPQVLI